MAAWKHDDYTSAWVCALPLELAAACAMLDERHPALPIEQHSRDNNTYILGRVMSHNVVIACLPSGITGTVSAARVVNLMLSTFRQIQFGLMIGIGGGAPSEEHDIRLGDVVVGKPKGLLGGVVQYDFGKTVQKGRFQRGGMLNKPPEILLTAMSSLEANHLMMVNQIENTIQEVFRKYPAMRAFYARPNDQSDRLFRANYEHPETQLTCSHCDKDQLECRAPRSIGIQSSQIHYGIIASGDQVVKHGAMRDYLRKELDALCFEMEAAGLVDSFPCLIIRGISDYADSHKNDTWQGYAAAVAAAYAKELMQVIPTRYIKQNAHAPVRRNESGSEDCRFAVHKWLSPSPVKDDLSNHLREYMDGSCQWAFDSLELRSFLGSANVIESLGIGGAPGSGKSTLTAFIVKYLMKYTDYHVFYFFCKGTDEEKNENFHVLRTLLSQILATDSRHDIFSWVNELRLQSGKKHAESFAVLEDAFQYTLANRREEKPFFIVVDALDECKDGCLLASTLLTSLSTSGENCRIILSSREDPHLIKILNRHQDLTQSPVRELIILPSRVRQPILAYIRRRISSWQHFNYIMLGKEVIEKVSIAADGSWLYARLMLDELERLPSAAAVSRQIKSVPNGLMQLYQTIFVAMELRLTPLELRLSQQLFLWVDMMDFVNVGRSKLDQEILEIVLQAQNSGEEVFDPIGLAQRLCSPLVTIIDTRKENEVQQGGGHQRQILLNFVHHTVVQFAREIINKERNTPMDIPKILKPQALKSLHRARTAVWYFDSCSKSKDLLTRLRANSSERREGSSGPYFEMTYGLWSALFLERLPIRLGNDDLAQASVICDELSNFLLSDKCLTWVEIAIIINFEGKFVNLFDNAKKALSAARRSLEITDWESTSKMLPAFQAFSVARRDFFADYTYVISRTGPAWDEGVRMPAGFKNRPLANSLLELGQKWTHLADEPRSRGKAIIRGTARRSNIVSSSALTSKRPRWT